MEEMILTYQLTNDIRLRLNQICSPLQIKLKEISSQDVSQSMGYIIGFPGYQRIEEQLVTQVMDQPFLFFVGFSSERLTMLLDLFKMVNMPFIPYKATLTESNIDFRFHELYLHVSEEYRQIKQRG